MSSETSPRPRRFQCDHPSCHKSYLRPEHLNRHRLTHKQRAFACYYCNRQFTRNDLLQVHLRRHEDRSFENVEVHRDVTPPHEGHRGALIRKSIPEWIEDLPAHVLRRSILSSSGSVSLPGPISTREQVQFSAGDETPPPENADHLMSQDQVTTSEVESVESYDIPQLSNKDCECLILEFPNLAYSSYEKRDVLQKLFDQGIKYLDTYMPFIHIPTFDISTASTYVFLAICCLGGALSPVPDTEHIVHGLQTCILNHARPAVMFNSAISASTLQAMVIVEYIGYYTLARKNFRMAILIHDIITHVRQRKNIFSGQPDGHKEREETLETQWKAWAEKEGLIRMAHCIFVNEVGYSMHFMHPQVTPTETFALPLPCPPELWKAKTAEKWKIEMDRNHPDHGVGTLQTSMDILFEASENRITAQCFEPNPFSMHILIYGISSAIVELNRSLKTASSRAVRLLKLEDFKLALTRWWGSFKNMDLKEQETEMAISALISYNFAYILIYADVDGISKAADIINEGNDAPALFHLADDAQINIAGQEAYSHTLEILRLCLDEQNDLSSRPPHGIYIEFLTVLVFWVSSMGLQHRKHQQQDWSQAGNSNSSGGMRAVIERENFRSANRPEDQVTMRGDVYRTMKTVKDDLACNSWHIAQKGGQILDSIMDKDDST